MDLVSKIYHTTTAFDTVTEIGCKGRIKTSFLYNAEVTLLCNTCRCRKVYPFKHI